MIYFVTPAWRRPEVTEVILAQRQLELSGLDLRTVVIADDENLDLGKRYGCDVIDHANDYLGRKVNLGLHHALESGCDFAAVVDSDSMVHRDLLEAHDWDPQTIHTSNNYADVAIDGLRLHYYNVRHTFGLGPIFWPRRVLEELDGKLADDNLQRGLSSSMWQHVLDAFPECLRWTFRNVHSLQYVGLKSKIGITRQANIARLWPVRTGSERKSSKPLQALRDHYSEEVVERVATLYRTAEVARQRPLWWPNLEIEGDDVIVEYNGAGPRVYRGRGRHGPVSMREGERHALPRAQAELMLAHNPDWFKTVEDKTPAPTGGA